jgi:uncharacterized protein (TIGR03437 family)
MRFMQRLFMALVLGTTGLAAQTAETIPFRAIMLPSNEVPAVNIAASGRATIWLHVVRDAQGRVVSASTDFDVSYTFPGTTTFTGLHIHSGPAGVNGPVTVNTGISGTSPIQSTGSGTIRRQAQTMPSDAAGLETVNGMLTNPAGYYVNLHTTQFPGGAIRGQLMRADMTVLIGFMNPRNEVPAITDNNASGIGSVIALTTRGDDGAVNSAQVIFDLNYQGFTEGTQFTGFHIHEGAAGVNGPVTINTGMQGGANAVPANPAGGNLHYEVEVPVENVAALRTVYGLMENPGNFYINLHSVVNPGGVIRAQLRRTDRLHFPILMQTANEVPPVTDVTASAPSAFTLYTARNAEGQVEGGVAIFDVNYRLPGGATFTGLHIHNGTASENGPVTINTGIGANNSVVTENGFGNIYRAVTLSTAPALATATSITASPERHYMNLHTTTHPGGLVRAQLGTVSTGRPHVHAVISAVSDPTMTTVAPYGLMTVFGSNMVRMASDVMASSDGMRLPTSFNGTQVTVGGRAAPIVSVGPDYIVAQVPSDVPAGMQPVIVTTGAGASMSVNVRVAAVAPALFFDAQGGLFVNTAMEFVGRANAPARRGETVTTIATGLGAVTGASPIATGQIVPSGMYSPAAVTVLVDGRAVQVVNASAIPGYVGLYMVTFMIPADARVGTVPVQLRMGDATSNTVNLVVDSSTTIVR